MQLATRKRTDDSGKDLVANDNYISVHKNLVHGVKFTVE